MRTPTSIRSILLGSAAALLLLGALAVVAENGKPLQGPEAFADVDDEAERSRALFVESGKVWQHARCINCHPAGDQPLQGETGQARLHDPPVFRGRVNFGLPAMRCDSCHMEHNVEHARVPGAPHWHLAPSSMAWEGKSLGEICRQLKDEERNGGLSLEELHTHVADDELVAWGWEPGPGLEPAPGSQARFADLVRAWIDSGAHCPPVEPIEREKEETR